MTQSKDVFIMAVGESQTNQYWKQQGGKLTYNGNPVRLSAESSIGLYKPEENGMIYSTGGKEVSTNKNNLPRNLSIRLNVDIKVLLLF